MDAERFARLKALFDQAVELPEAERAGFLESETAGDAELKDAVLAMLNEDSAGTPVFDSGLSEIAAELLGNPIEWANLEEIGAYRLKEFIGQGGMGVVWLAERMDAGNLVAIKFLLHAGLSPARLDRFILEIKTLAKLEHPFIARFLDAGVRSDGTRWFAMEYVKGLRLDEYCEAHGLSIDARLRLLRKVCEAVQYAHGQAVIHRDLKPWNIMVAEDGTPRLLDFGIAKEMQPAGDADEQTTPALRLVSLDYAAPEWMLKGDVGVYTDVYSLGVMLYQLLTGRLPFDRTKIPAGEFASYIAGHDPEKPSAVAARRARGGKGPGERIDKSEWRELDTLCLKAMHRDITQRYKTIEAVIRDIDHYLNQEPLEARPVTVSYRLSKFVKRNRTAVLATAAAVLLIVAMTAFFTIRLAKARNAAVAEARRTQRIQQFMLNVLGGSDQKAAPAKDLKVITLLDHGVQEADSLSADPETQAELYESLGNMYDMLGDFPKAEKLLMLALDRIRKVPDASDAKTSEILVQIGIVKDDESDFDTAEKYVQQGIALVSRRLPASDPSVLSAKSALGRVVAESGDFKRAIGILEPLVQMQPNGTETDYSLSENLTSLAVCEYSIGNNELSNALVRRSLDLDRRLFGATHPQVANDLIDAGENEAEVSHDKQAEAYYRQAIDIQKAWYGDNNPDLGQYEALLGRLLEDEGKLEEGEGALRSALQVEEHIYGHDDGHLAPALDSLGRIERDRGNLTGAEADFQRALDVGMPAFGPDNYNTGVFEADLGETYRLQKQYPRAEAMLSKAVKTLLATVPPGAWTTGEAEASWGRSLLALKRYAEAEKQLTAAYAIYGAQDHTPLPLMQKMRQDLAATYQGLKQPEKVRKFEAEMASAQAARPVPASK
jgi:serine/threonine-protein kinase